MQTVQGTDQLAPCNGGSIGCTPLPPAVASPQANNGVLGGGSPLLIGLLFPGLLLGAVLCGCGVCCFAVWQRRREGRSQSLGLQQPLGQQRQDDQGKQLFLDNAAYDQASITESVAAGSKQLDDYEVSMHAPTVPQRLKV